MTSTKQEKVVAAVEEKKPESKLIEEFRAARRVGVPLLVIQTVDPAAIIDRVNELTTIEDSKFFNAPVIKWDYASGLTPINNTGKEAIKTAIANASKPTKPEDVLDAGGMLQLMKHLPPKSILFLMNFHRFIGSKTTAEARVNQALWNLRDVFKINFRTAVILTPGIEIPEELKNDLISLDDPLPTSTEFDKVIRSLYKSAHANNEDFPEEPTKEIAQQTVEAVKGLSLFKGEQVMAMSLTREGVDLKRLWNMKRSAIEEVPGLRLYQGTETFADVRGVQNMKDYLSAIMHGEDAPTVLVFWDELEKAVSGSRGGDLSGVSQEMHGMLLSWMADEDIPALRFTGIQGCSKSHIVKATGGQFKKPVVIMSISELKGGIVGQSTQQLRTALKTVSAIGRPLVVATCNDEEALSSELRDRFSLGCFFFDLFNKVQRKDVWDLYIKKLGLKSSSIPEDDEGWTPRNIKDCCSLAWRLRSTPEYASRFIVPTMRSAPERIKELREKADGKYLSASYPGVYVYDNAQKEEPARGIET